MTLFWHTDADTVLDAALDCEGEGGEWIITRDHLAEQFPADFEHDHATNRTRSYGWDAVCAVLKATKTRSALYAFKLYDDDGELYYEGVCTDESFGPLDWARYDSGCTEIKYRQKDGSWQTL